MKTNPGKRAARKPFVRQFYRGNKRNLAICLFATIVMSAVSIVLSFLIQQIIDSITGAANALPLGTTVWITVGLIVACFVFGAIDTVFTPRFTSKAMRQYKTYVYDRLLEKSISSFSDENTSTYISALSNDAASIESNYLKSIWQTVEYTVWFFGAFALMLWYSPILTLIAVAASLLPVAASLLTGGKMGNAEKEVSRQNESFIASLKDTLCGFTVIKSFKAEREVGKLFGKVTTETEAKKCRRDRLQSAVNYIGMLTGVAAQLAVFLIGAALAGEEASVTPGVLMAFVNVMGMVVGPIAQLPPLIAKRRAALGLIDKLSDSLSENLRHDGEPVPPQLDDAIELRGVSFAYEDGKPVLTDIDARFEAGKSYAIVGGSGSGKSTLLNLLMASHTDYSGEIRYDGKELRQIGGESLYDITTLIQQNVFVFDNTIKENITMFRPFPDDEVESAIRLSGLSALIEEKGAAYDCGENGVGLSGGERQRISIARALLRKTPVLLVDEATAALDAETAYCVADSILKLDGHTRIVVTHALNESLLSRYDGILVLKNGAIAEQGTFCDLMEKKGYFYSLFTVSQ